MSILSFEVIGYNEESGEKFRSIVKIKKERFRKDYGLAPTSENVRRHIVCDFLESNMVVSKINILAPKS